MRNRWGTELQRGLQVTCHHPRGGTFTGVIVGFEGLSGYGWRIKLDSGQSASIDDVDASSGYAAWNDARRAAADMARRRNGHAVLVAEGERYAVLVGTNVESCMQQAAGRPILADFDQDGRQS
jgi:hypothetical protein